MTIYISILRGINVSGQKLIKMDALKKTFENLKFENVRTCIQSGNVIFSCNETNEKELEVKIEKQIETDFGFHVAVIVLTAETLKQIIGQNHFAKESEKESSFLHVTFLGDKPKQYDIKSIEDKKQEREEIQFSENAIYLYCPNGYGKTKLANSFIECKLKVKATTRNWKTTNELLAMATK